MTIYNTMLRCILNQQIRNCQKPISKRCEGCGLEPICNKIFNRDPISFDLDKLVEYDVITQGQKDHLLSLRAYNDYIKEVNNEY